MTGPEDGTHPSPTERQKVRLEPYGGFFEHPSSNIRADQVSHRQHTGPTGQRDRGLPEGLALQHCGGGEVHEVFGNVGGLAEKNGWYFWIRTWCFLDCLVTP